MRTITEGRAKQLTIERYRQLFADTYLHNSEDGNYYPYPPLDVDAITRVESGPDGFVLYAEPPAGVSLEARVERSGRWVELVRVSYAAE